MRLIASARKRKVIEHESEEEILEGIDQLREFDKKKEDILEDKAVIEQKEQSYKKSKQETFSRISSVSETPFLILY